MQSTTDEVRIQASQRITLSAGQSQVVIEGGNITFTCPEAFTVKGTTHEWGGGGSLAAGLMHLPDQRLTEPASWIDINRTDAEGMYMACPSFNTTGLDPNERASDPSGNLFA